MKKQEMVLEVSVTSEEAQALQTSLGMVISMIQGNIDEWENTSDKSLELLCYMYDKQFTVMSVWRKVLAGLGMPEEMIREALDMEKSDESSGEE